MSGLKVNSTCNTTALQADPHYKSIQSIDKYTKVSILIHFVEIRKYLCDPSYEVEPYSVWQSDLPPGNIAEWLTHTPAMHTAASRSQQGTWRCSHQEPMAFDPQFRTNSIQFWAMPKVFEACQSFCEILQIIWAHQFLKKYQKLRTPKEGKPLHTHLQKQLDSRFWHHIMAAAELDVKRGGTVAVLKESFGHPLWCSKHI